MNISVVVPLLDEEESLPELASWIDRVCHTADLSYEIVMIDDGSKDRSWEVIQELARTYPVKAIRFQRNYGKSAALNEGFALVQGEVVITMDADLQDSPDEIPELYRMVMEDGYDLVSGWKQKRYDPITKTIPTKFYNATTRLASGIQLNDFNCGLKAYRKRVVKSIEVYGEMHRYIPVIAKWAGFPNIGEKVVQHQSRKYGSTKFGWDRFINGYLDLLSIMFISRFGKRPMHFFGTIGSLAFLLGFVVTIWLLGQKIYCTSYELPYREVTDQPLFYLALVAIVIGAQLFLAGFLGELISRTDPDKNRYLVAERVGWVESRE